MRNEKVLRVNRANAEYVRLVTLRLKLDERISSLKQRETSALESIVRHDTRHPNVATDIRVPVALAM
jgi:hypothetical protein